LVQAERVRAGADGGLFGCDCDGLRGVGRDGDRHGQRAKGYRTKCGLDIRRGAWRLCRLEYPYEPDLLGRPNARRSGCNDGCPTASLPPHIAVSDLVRRVKGCSSQHWSCCFGLGLNEYLPADAGGFVLLTILKYDIVRDVAAGGGEIAPSPEMPAPVAHAQVRELHPHARDGATIEAGADRARHARI
jgi:hypothetical protein